MASRAVSKVLSKECQEEKQKEDTKENTEPHTPVSGKKRFPLKTVYALIEIVVIL